jgi:DNA replication protein DnaC
MNTDSLKILLRDLGLQLFEREFVETIAKAEHENWGYARFLHFLAEIESAGRVSRKIERLLKDAGLPPAETLERLDPQKMPEKARRQLPTLTAGDFVRRGDNLLLFGLPGRGKTAFASALSRALIHGRQMKVRFIPTFKLVSELLAAKRDLRLPDLLVRLNRYDVIVVDDLGYAKHDREEMDVLFNFFAERYEKQRTLILTSNLVFSEWDKVFKDAMTATAAVDRLVHRSIVFEFTGPSIRENEARDRNAAA